MSPPLLKKLILDTDNMNNYRHVTKLSFVSEVVKQTAVGRLHGGQSTSAALSCGRFTENGCQLKQLCLNSGRKY